MNPDELDHRVLLEAVARRDADALERLVTSCMPRVYGLALRITCDPATAEAVAQDAFVKVWECADRFDATRLPALAWVMAIARACALERMRGRLASPAPADGAAADLQDLVTATEGDTALHAAVVGLDHELRRTLELTYFRNFSHSELASHLDLTVDVARSSLRRAMDGIRPVPRKQAA